MELLSRMNGLAALLPASESSSCHSGPLPISAMCQTVKHGPVSRMSMDVRAASCDQRYVGKSVLSKFVPILLPEMANPVEGFEEPFNVAPCFMKMSPSCLVSAPM